MKRSTHPKTPIAFNRRRFLAASGMLTFAALPDLARGADASDTRLLVILLRGGMDGLFAMPPIGDDDLGSLRKNLKVENYLPLDGFFALHDTLENVHRAYDDNQALLVHATSLPYKGRSHFEGQDIMESGVMRPYASPTGWLGRALDLTSYSAAISMTLPVPLILRGQKTADTIYPTWMETVTPAVYRKVLPAWSSDPDLASLGTQMTAQAADMSRSSGRVAGQDNSIIDMAKQAAVKLKMPDGPRVAVIDHVGFDTHANQPGEHADRLHEIDDAIGAFRNAMRDAWNNTLVVTVTEFGRTAAENGSWGTDHGYGSAIFVLGGKVKKSGIVADWPGLTKKKLFEGRDLMATIDARSLYAKIVSTSLGIDLERVRKEVMEHDKSTLFDAYLG